MQISNTSTNTVCNELELLQQHLDLENAKVLELGCGKARTTRLIAESEPSCTIIAAEVDEIQHRENLASEQSPQIEFTLGGAEEIAADDSSIDIVLMFKSLHHVPVELMPKAFSEISRVLKAGGSLWISEPVFAGEFNEVLRLFHDEEQVRAAAFNATENVVNQGQFELTEQLFCATESRYADFSEFDQRIIQVTHTNHQLDPALYDKVKDKFNEHIGPQGAVFYNPIRIDHLRKPV